MQILSFHTLVFITCLTGCTVDPSSQALVDAFHQYQAANPSNKSPPRLNPDFNYLRVQIDSREVFMALGYIDKSPDGPIEVWYSALGEVLRLRDGRLIGATLNKETDWISVSFTHLPRWDQIGTQFSFERTQDLSPGYRYGMNEKMFIKPIIQPNDSQLQLIPPTSLTWFEERAENMNTLPPTRYGVNMTTPPQVIYAEQCLSSTFCFSWQKWTSAKESKN